MFGTNVEHITSKNSYKLFKAYQKTDNNKVILYKFGDTQQINDPSIKGASIEGDGIFYDGLELDKSNHFIKDFIMYLSFQCLNYLNL